jgi:V8-like Glu-specific endopeptidase
MVGGSSPNNARGRNGLLEKDLALDLALRVGNVLEKWAIDVRLTRDADSNLGLKARADIAREAGADAFVSIHFNGSKEKNAQGTETWRHPAASSDSKALAGLVQASVQKATGLADRGVRVSDFGVLRPDRHASKTAACLVEVSFMDCAAEEARLGSEVYKDRIASALAGAVMGWLIADGRLDEPECVDTTGTGDAERDDSPQDGYEAENLDAECAEEWIAPPRTIRQDRAGGQRRPALAESAELSLSVDFFADPHERASAKAAGVESLARMQRGWLKERRCPAGSADVHPEIAIGIDESLEAVFLDLLARQRQAVGIIHTRGVNFRGERGTWSGTGFLVAPNLLLTNHHVLNSPEVADAAEVVFDYEFSAEALASGRKTTPGPGRRYRLQAERLFVTSPFDDGLDYSFVWIEDVEVTSGKLIRMERAAFSTQRDERAFIIHHPHGEPKRVSLDDTDILTANADGAVLHYTSDTEPGSSGAPVFDRSGRLIALHHASRTNSDGIPTADGTIPKYLNEGIKLAAIALDLEVRRAHEASSMIDIVLGEVYGSDTLSSFFGAAGREVAAGRSGADRVGDVYHATAQDLDIGFWNIAWFADRYQEMVGEVASMIVDLGLDIWVLGGTLPAATAALAQAIEQKFGLQLAYLPAEDDAPASLHSTALLWNPATVDGERIAWPREIEALFRLRSDNADVDAGPDSQAGRIFGRNPGLFRVHGKNGAGDGIAFNLVPLFLEATDDDWGRRRLASQVMARAVEEMIRHHGADQDWVLGGDFSAERASGDFEEIGKAQFKSMSAQDEANGALSYLKSPDSLIDQVFLSPNLSRLHGPQDGFILLKEKSQVDYLKRFADHCPVLLRLSARSGATEPKPPVGLDHALTARMDALLRQSRG